MSYIVIDQGTSSTKAFLFDANGKVISQSNKKCKLETPKPFHIECNPVDILDDIIHLFNELVSASYEHQVHGLGFAFQRSTFLFWEKSTCIPLTPAISWQDTRANKYLSRFKEYEREIWSITGSPLSAHFGGPKFYHVTQSDRDLKRRVKNGEVYFGPLSSYITHAITGSPSIDESIAGRTQLYDLANGCWSKYILDLFEVPVECLPSIKPVSHKYGKFLDSQVPILAVIGDQQGALIGHAGLRKSAIGANFGTSASIQCNVGEKPSMVPGLISSILFSDQKRKYYLVEGTINSCNSVFYHLEKILSIPHEKMFWDIRANETRTNGIYVPGFNGLSAPYWESGFEDIFIDLGSDPNQIIRAGMESIGFLFNDILNCFRDNNIIIPRTINVSGGAARPVLLQFISDITDLNISYSKIKDRTAFGVYKILKGKSLMDQNYEIQSEKNFKPKYLPNKIKKMDKWRNALATFKKEGSYSEM